MTRTRLAGISPHHVIFRKIAGSWMVCISPTQKRALHWQDKEPVVVTVSNGRIFIQRDRTRTLKP
ncbi:hypothetical protein LCGC14_0723170 [marine sediment metagenome]|uniref:SpoVT-AbrB domain-containing protein n=1 Tax=marine sediment metagenome TaxID=412755 RepID=A0A0F9SX43_9ZZZZ